MIVINGTEQCCGRPWWETDEEDDKIIANLEKKIKRTYCTQCGKEISIYAVFPHGYCVDCHAKATENEPQPTAKEWAKEWSKTI